MARYANGEIPDGILESIGSGTDENGKWEWQATRATIARFRAAQQYALEHFGREIGIRTGWNMYRPLFSQEVARRNACASGNCNGAAVPRSSSHGGNWYYNGQLRDCLAIDIDPNGLSWAQAQEACRAAGFATGLITEAISGIRGGEPWHVIDFNAFDALASEGSNTFEEDELNTEQNRMLENIYAAIFNGGPSMPDDGASLASTVQQTRAGVASIQRYLFAGGPDVDATIGSPNSVFGRLVNASGGTTVDVDEEALAAALAPLLNADTLQSLSDADVARIAKASADEQAKRLSRSTS